MGIGPEPEDRIMKLPDNWNVAVVTVELLGCTDTPETPTRIAIPVTMDQEEIDSTWAFPSDAGHGGGLSGLGDRVGRSIDFSGLDICWEVRGVRWNEDAPVALLPGERLMTLEQVNAMFARWREVEIAEDRETRAASPFQR